MDIVRNAGNSGNAGMPGGSQEPLLDKESVGNNDNVAITAGTQASIDCGDQLTPEINRHYTLVIRTLKASLTGMVDLGSKLSEAKCLLGDAFSRWVTTQLPLDAAEAELLIRICATAGLNAEDLSPASEVRLQALFDLLTKLAGLCDRDVPAHDLSEVSGADNVSISTDSKSPDSQVAQRQDPNAEPAGDREPGDSEPEESGSRAIVQNDIDDLALTTSQRAAVAANLVEAHEAALAAGEANHVGPDLSKVNKLFLAVARDLKASHPAIFEELLAGKISAPRAKSKAAGNANHK